MFYALADGLEEVLDPLDELLERVAPQMSACKLTVDTVASSG